MFNVLHRKKELLNIIGALFVALVVALPIIAIFYLALTPEKNIWPHLISTVLPGYITTTLGLLFGVGLISFIIGVGSAWIITIYEFPFRSKLEWLLLIPLAMPTYIIAYSYGELFDYSGPIQTYMRSIFNWNNSKDYWFPDLFTLGGAIFVISFVLYPYVYLTARAAFMRQTNSLIEASSTLGCSMLKTFYKIALPMARPAIVVGIILVLMECLNEFAALEYFGVNTLTVGVYVTWLQKNNLGGASQIAIVMLLFIFSLIVLERKLRKNRTFHQNSKNSLSPNRINVIGYKAWILSFVCFVPILIGFIAPAFVLIKFVLMRYYEVDLNEYFHLVFNSIFLASIASMLTVFIGIYLINSMNTSNNLLLKISISISRIGYALPGVVLALGIMVPLIHFDRLIQNIFSSFMGISLGLIFTGTFIAIIYAYIVRFLTIAYGTVESGFSSLSPNMAMASRTLGKSQIETLLKIELPIVRPAIIAAALLVFVDSMKELPATLLLRPFNFDTLSTHVYTYASLSAIEDAALPALTIVLTGILPIILLNRTLMLKNK